jgi:hypothetical protein
VLRTEHVVLLVTFPPRGNQREYTNGGVLDWDALMRGVFRHLSAAMAEGRQVLVNRGLIHRDSEWRPSRHGWLQWMRTRDWWRFGVYALDQGPGLAGNWNGRLTPTFKLLFHFNRVARQTNKIVPCTLGRHVQRGAAGFAPPTAR